jgi:bifunctional DNA-binding transcriptional regulator/antitoxin component of YhaV-PrlF toxin-antitoxin module
MWVYSFCKISWRERVAGLFREDCPEARDTFRSCPLSAGCDDADRLDTLVRTQRVPKEILVASLSVTAKGQVTLGRDLLQHLGIKPGGRVDFEKLPDGELRVRAARPTGTIDGFLHSLHGKVKREKPLSIEDIDRIAAAGWTGDPDQPRRSPLIPTCSCEPC